MRALDAVRNNRYDLPKLRNPLSYRMVCLAKCWHFMKLLSINQMYGTMSYKDLIYFSDMNNGLGAIRLEEEVIGIN